MMNNGSNGNAPVVPNYTPPCGANCKCGAGWQLVTSSTLTSVAIPSETETVITSREITDTIVTQLVQTSSTMTQSKWVGQHEEEYDYDVTFVNGRWIQKWTDVEKTCVKWTTTDIFFTWTGTEATEIPTEYTTLTKIVTSVPGLTETLTETVIAVPGEGDETTVTLVTGTEDTSTELTRTHLVWGEGEIVETYLSETETEVRVEAATLTAGQVVTVDGVDDEADLVVYNAKGLVARIGVSAHYEGSTWVAGKTSYTIPETDVWYFRMEYKSNWGGPSSPGSIILPVSSIGRTMTQTVELELTRTAVGETWIEAVESYIATVAASYSYTTVVAVDGEPDSSTVVQTATVVASTVTEVTDTIVTATKAISTITEVEKFRYYTKAATYLGTKLASELTSEWQTFVDRTIATGTRVVDDYVIETWYEDVETEVSWTLPTVVENTETATVAATEWTDTEVVTAALVWTPPKCTETTLTETVIGTETTLTETVIGHKCRGAIYYGTDTQEMDGVDFRGESIAMVRNGSGAHRKIF